MVVVKIVAWANSYVMGPNKIESLTIFDRKIHTFDMLLMFLLEPIQKFCLKIAKTENCQTWKLLDLKAAKIVKIENC